MRFRAIAYSCMLVAVSAGGVKTLAARPDCARWIKEYQQGLANHAVLAKRHVVHAAHRIAVPRPKLLRASIPGVHTRPRKLSPEEMLKRFKVLCGEDLPDDVLPASFVPTDLEAAVVPPVELGAPSFSGLDTPIAFLAPPINPVASGTTPTSGGTNGGGDSPVTGTTGGFPSTPIVPTTPGTPNTPTIPVTPTSPISPVPEPTSLILLLTGGLSTIPTVLRRRRRQ